MTSDETLHDLETLLAVDATQLGLEAAFTHAALLIDAAVDVRSASALAHAEIALDRLDALQLPDEVAARLQYFRANLWSARSDMAGETSTWDWRLPTTEHEVLALRRAVRHPGFAALPPLARGQTFTNLGNRLNGLGRFVEAVEAWDRALIEEPRMAMARGNRGFGLGFYGEALYDPGHMAVFYVAAWEGLRSALSPEALLDSHGLDHALIGFGEAMKRLGQVVDVAQVKAAVELDKGSLGRSKAERAYRRWCLARRLMLNPLNDLGAFPIAARDVLTLPTLTTSTADTPPAIAFFNLMKQEYVSARFSLYEGSQTEGVHHSDRAVLLYDTLDYPLFTYRVEQVKGAFRAAYALLDKTAFLLNSHFALGHNVRTVNFRNVWFGRDGALHPRLTQAPNWPLRGLYWLSKDVFERQFKAVMEPDAEAIYELRNHLEHKFVAVHDGVLWPDMMFTGTTAEHEGLLHVAHDELILRTTRMLRFARAALIYLSLGIHADERHRAATGPRGRTGSLPLFTVRDQAKRSS